MLCYVMLCYVLINRGYPTMTLSRLNTNISCTHGHGNHSLPAGGTQRYTLFVPSNDAFANLPADILRQLTSATTYGRCEMPSTV